MLKIDPQSRTLLSLGRRTLQPGPLFARHSVADLVANSTDVFFAELGRAFFVVSTNTPLSTNRGRRADFLLLDPSGRLYVTRLQRPDRGIDLIDALEDTACVSTWKPERILALLEEERREMLEKAFLAAPVDQINQEQGLLLLAESYDVDTLASAEWLRSQYGVSIDCYQLRLATDSLTKIEYLSCRKLTKDAGSARRSQPEAAESKQPAWPAEAFPDISDGPKRPKPAPAPPPPPPVAPEPAYEPAPEPVAAVAEEKPESLLDAEVAATLAGDPDLYFTGELSPEEDPLADIIAGQQEAKEEGSGEPSRERRSTERSRDYHARRLRLDYFGRLLGARLVDFSENGLGVEALSPLPVGAEIGISGEILGVSTTVGIEGRAKVEHCRSTQEGVCRIGFSLANAVITEIDDPETFDRR